MSVALVLGIGCLGGLGSVARFVLERGVSQRFPVAFPVGTLAVNLSGSLAAGLVVGLGAAGDTALLLGSALIGGYTTFSAWMVETLASGREDGGATALANLGVSLVAGLLAVWVGRELGVALA